MKTVSTNKEFVKTLASLSLPEQRYLGAKFISSVLDIMDEPRLRTIVDGINKNGLSAEELHSAHKLAHTIYIESHPQSDLSEVNFTRQAEHMTAEACMDLFSTYLSGSNNITSGSKGCYVLPYGNHLFKYGS